MTRLVPQSLAGQLATLLVAALLVAHLAGLLVLLGERRDAIQAAIRFGVVERIAALVEVIDDATPELATRLADALSSRRARIEIAERSALPPGGMSPAEAEFARSLAAELELTRGEPRVRFAEPMPPPDRPVRRRRAATDVTISIPLSGSRWLNAQSSFRVPSVAWSWPWLVSLVASAVATLSVVGLLVRRITDPMRDLAAAAEKVGRGEPALLPRVGGPVEIRTTVAAFNAMQERLGRFVADRTRMVAAVSHDLRTPLTSLRLRAEFIEDEELKRDILRTVEEMQAMADATLAFAREEATQEETRSVDLAALIESLVQDQIALGRVVAYSGPERLAWRGRPSGLKRAVGNLVENAVRYAGSAIVRLAPVADGVDIVVEDDGPGIPESRMSEVFEPFVRLETSRSRDTGGVGLGLSIARSIARAHGGDVTLRNRAGGGLSAAIHLP